MATIIRLHAIQATTILSRHKLAALFALLATIVLQLVWSYLSIVHRVTTALKVPRVAQQMHAQLALTVNSQTSTKWVTAKTAQLEYTAQVQVKLPSQAIAVLATTVNQKQQLQHQQVFLHRLVDARNIIGALRAWAWELQTCKGSTMHQLVKLPRLLCLE